MKRKRRGFAAVAGLLMGGLMAAVLPAQTAQAASGYDRCPTGYFCGFTGTSGDGTMFKTKVNMPTMGSWDNKIRSYTNRAGQISCLYTQANYSLSGPDGSYWAEDPNSPGEGSWSSHLDRAISSIKWVRTERECSQNAYPRWWPETAPKAAGFGDLDNNRTPDILVRDGVGRLWFLPGDNSGRLVGNGWNAMTALTRHGDLTGDGREDLLARDKSGTLWVYPGRGNGTFGARTSVGTGWNAMTAIKAAGDLTGDGRKDMLARDTTGRLWLYPGRGNGAFAARKSLGTGWNAMNQLIGSGDMNGDAKADLLARDTTGKLWFYPGTGKGGFGVRKLLGSGWQVMQTMLAVGSFDGDAKNDLLTITNDKYLGGHPGWLLGYRLSTTAPSFLRAQELDGDWWGLNSAY
ncbi:FG-GAP-like repeat-containing protein [Streptomyces sp. NPDC052236]|uniref:FG-GAP-like repeat-containing protein n=1 Tax=Streptomyces sp. NPDC052236 TaxID=3365686 RepID=UPI0037CE5E12